MNKKTVITIGRQFGSGGRQVGRRIADELGVPFYDKELLAHAAKESGMAKELLRITTRRPPTVCYIPCPWARIRWAT